MWWQGVTIRITIPLVVVLGVVALVLLVTRM